MANSAAVDLGSLDGWFKEREGELSKAVMTAAKIQKDIPLTGASKLLGGDYVFPVSVRRSQGVTLNGAANDGFAFALNSVVAPVHQQARVNGSECVVRDNIAYGVISRSNGDEKAFGPVVLETARNLKESADFFAELCLLYGGKKATGSGIGDVLAVTRATRVATITFTTQTWAPGIWAQLEGGLVEAYTAAGTKIGSGALAYVKSVKPNTRQIVVSGAATAWMASITASTHFVPKGFVTNAFVGLHGITNNATSLFSISAATYNLWKSNVYDCDNEPLTFSKVLDAVNMAVGRGLMEDVTCYVNVYAWTDLNTDLAALRRYNASTKSRADLGSTEIEFYGSNGTIRLVPHPMLMAGDAFIVPTKRLRRIGSTPTTFRLPGLGSAPTQNSSEFFSVLPDNAGVQMRCYWDQAMIATQPAKFVYIKKITPNSIQGGS